MNAAYVLDRSYATIRQRLLTWAYRPGQRLEANRIADDIAVSMTPVRDALNRLTGEGLVEAEVGEGFRVPFTPAEMLDTTTVLDGYTCDDIGAGEAAPAILAVGGDEVTEIERTPAELAGATSKPIAIANGVGAATFAVRQTPGQIPMGLVRDGAGGGRVFLNLENIAGRGDSANYDVFLAGADHPETPFRAGQISLFGLEEATDLKTGEGGLNKVLDITGIADQLGLTRDGESQLAIRLQRRPRRTDATPAPERGDPKLEVGRASIYFTE